MANIDMRFDRISIGMTVLTAALLFAAILPLFLVDIPAMLDYANHLARMYLLSGPPNPAYEPHWGLYPDLAMDIVVPNLARWASVTTATKIFLGAAQILIVSGAVFLELTVKRRHRLGGIGALLVLFSLPFAWGQVNFMFGLGLAVWGVALWIRLRDRPGGIRWAVHAAVVAILYVSHFFDLGVYGLVVGLYELSRLRRPIELRPLAKLTAFIASPALFVLGAAAFSGDGVAKHASGMDWNFVLKLSWAAVFMNVYDTSLSMLTAGALLLLVIALAGTRRLSLTRGGIWIGGGLLAAYIAAPRQIFGSQYLDVRLIAVAMIVLPAFTTTSLSTTRWRAVSLATAIAIVVSNEAATARAWIDYAKDYKEFNASFAQLAPGSAVLIGQQDQAGREYQPIFYAATLAAPLAGVFVSSLYAQPGMQPIQPRARYRRLAVAEERESYPPRLAALRTAMTDTALAGTQANIVGWPRRYQYLYMLGAPGPNPLPAILTRLTVGRRFSLYRIGVRPS